MRPRNRRLKLAGLGAILISAAGVAGVLFPHQAAFLAKLAFAIAGLLSTIAGSMAVDDVQSAKVDVARINAQTPPDPVAPAGSKTTPTQSPADGGV